MTDVKLQADLTCPGDGLIIGADGITVDLNGHVLTGSGSGVGITVRGRRGVLVVDGPVRGFTTGILVAASSAVVIRENLLTGNREGIFLNGSSANIVKENVAWQNGLRGIMIRPNLSGVQSTQNLVLENILIDNPSGILLFGQSGNTLKENAISGSTVAAIDLTGPGASGNLLKENRTGARERPSRDRIHYDSDRLVDPESECCSIKRDGGVFAGGEHGGRPMRLARTVGLGLIGSATTMLVRGATRRAMHAPDGTPRLPNAAKRNSGFGAIVVLAAAAGAMLALADILHEQRNRQMRRH